MSDTLTAKQVAEMLGIQLNSVYEARLRGRGPISHRRGNRLVFLRTDVENFLASERQRSRKGEGV